MIRRMLIRVSDDGLTIERTTDEPSMMAQTVGSAHEQTLREFVDLAVRRGHTLEAVQQALQFLAEQQAPVKVVTGKGKKRKPSKRYRPNR